MGQRLDILLRGGADMKIREGAYYRTLGGKKPAPRWKGRKMSDDLVARLMAVPVYDDIKEAADLIDSQQDCIETQAAEIIRLRAAIATARREGMEKAAQVAINLSISTPSVIAAAIRAAAREMK